jgi:phosphatidate cytidylyltransferase
MIIEVFRREEKPLLNISTLVFAFVWLGIMLGSLSNLRNLQDIGLEVTLALFLSVWICDTSAFFFGRKFGNKRIIPDVSPNKTWIGTLAGFICSIIFMLILNKYDFFNGIISLPDTIAFDIISGGFGQLGDWTESLLKREAGLKDTSNLLRGHGGILISCWYL